MRRHPKLIRASLLLAVTLPLGLVIARDRGIPFVAQREQWTIGIYAGDSPFHFDAFRNIWNPVLTAEDVTDVRAKFVADPFLVQADNGWNLFFEVYNYDTDQGDLAVATSTNTIFWKYQRLILDEPFHLSYPYVFEWQGEHYLIPESYQAAEVRLYRAVDFPLEWQYDTTLIEGKELVDNSIAYFDGYWWLFSSEMDNATLRLYYAADLRGPWREHPASPVVEDNTHIARPGGRVLVHDERVYRFTMDIDPNRGHQVRAFEITEVTPTAYAEVPVSAEPILQGSGSGWNASAMHQLDPVRVADDRWLAAVDGYGKYLFFDLRY